MATTWVVITLETMAGMAIAGGVTSWMRARLIGARAAVVTEEAAASE